ncbi:formate dehydrogenase accessory sulfurtransferase FdhD [[Clostridium] dakarense]|uniref:formate dehydrogenase accessory sulfurtransferase FdhD n=1 Tax=Faecalimicrobium dakarense TaxID=1301100 RepID=UPI0004B57F28|nr:formate dehydrogenase accessory sulfurtransferase FdhD [[Clostridium] dakarense]
MIDSTLKVPIVKFEDSKMNNLDEDIIVEYPLKVILNDVDIGTLLCTPYNLYELIVGFIKNKGYIEKFKDIDALKIDKESRVAIVNTHDKRIKTEKLGISKSDININIEKIYKIMERNLTYSSLFKDTGGVHSVSIFDDNKELIICEDVARHNAMDKAIGYCIINDISLEDKIVVVSGRISQEMMLKAVNNNIPIVVSKSAPTNLSIELAKKLNITLIGFVRGRRMNIYANEHRIIIK